MPHDQNPCRQVTLAGRPPGNDLGDIGRKLESSSAGLGSHQGRSIVKTFALRSVWTSMKLVHNLHGSRDHITERQGWMPSGGSIHKSYEGWMRSVVIKANDSAFFVRS